MDKMYDAIVVGGGAAGLMTAITASRSGASILLLEGQKQIGAKILMSGGTRCNVTNRAVSERDYNSEQLMTVRNILRAFDNEDAIKFFEELGVELVLEETGKYFPVTNSGETVLDALLRGIEDAGAELRLEQRVTAISAHEGVFTVECGGVKFQSRAVVLTTGGLSYPGTGSDGVGYSLAKTFGHKIINTTPALTPLTSSDAELKALSGITLPVRLTLRVDGKKRIAFEDSFLFTHLGFSGPSALDISRHWLRAEEVRELSVNFIPSMSETDLEKMILAEPNRNVKTVLLQYLPERLVDLLLLRSRIALDLPVNRLKVAERKALIQNCLNTILPINGSVGYKKAEATAGGIDLASVNPKNLESKYQPNLYFAGEILDVDGRIGGFNFQWAWASGHVVGYSLGRSLKKRDT